MSAGRAAAPRSIKPRPTGRLCPTRPGPITANGTNFKGLNRNRYGCGRAATRPAATAGFQPGGTVVGQVAQTFPPLTAEQRLISDDVMKHWHEVLPARFGAIERFNHSYPVRTAPAEFRRTWRSGPGSASTWSTRR